jgi:gliding motility-associated-like protein
VPPLIIVGVARENDALQVYFGNILCIKTVRLRIYDRWGQEIFQKTGYTLAKAWNGETIHSKDVTPGVYFYVLELRDDKKQELKGSITVVR